LIALKHEELTGKRVMMFSYGSGLTATMFSLRVARSLAPMAQQIDLKNRLAQRIKMDPAEFTKTLALRRDRVGQKDYVPAEATHDMFPGTYYLDRIDDKHRRFYKRKVAHTPAKL
jgi:hydroxymethylglutaryl-CoA synthase